MLSSTSTSPRWARAARIAGALVLLLTILPAAAYPAYTQGNSRTFPETGKTVKGRFLEYWTQNGGLAQQGYPISDELQERSDTNGKTYTVQYFERAVFEVHPENARPYDVLLSLLGNSYYRQKYPSGAPGQAASASNPRKFAETGKSVGGRFRAYWEANGGLAQQGYPVSEEFSERSDLNGKTYTVQYFERAVFEYHPENKAPYDVLLSQLGTFRYKAKYTNSANLTLDQFFDKVFFDLALRDPENFTGMGLPRSLWHDFRPNTLTNVSDAYIRQTYDLARQYRTQLTSYKPAPGTPQQLSQSILAWYLDDLLAGQQYIYDDYILNPMYGAQINLHDLMTDLQPLTNKQDAEDYVARLRAFGPRMDGVLEQMKLREQKGIFMPRWMVDSVISQIAWYTPSDAKASDFYTTLTRKLGALQGVSSADKETIYAAAQKAIVESVYPAYRRVSDYLAQIRPKSRDTDGVWALPDGDAYYAWLVKHHTNLDMTPEEVHNLGLKEVARIQGELKAALLAAGINTPTLSEGLQRVAQASGVYSTGTQQGRQEVLAAFRSIIDKAQQSISPQFDLMPRSPVEVRGVDAGAGGYYVQPALDGSRPGVFYANLSSPYYPKYSMPTLAYHEAVPGHHFQLSVQVELQNVPLFQKATLFALPTAYVEGWALYAEKLAYEAGLYKDDPYGNIGRLKSELFRASRLVVDTGIHWKHWSRAQAIAYMDEANGTMGGAYTAEVERYIAWPGQALAYKTGELKILELRNRARSKLGSGFDIKEFHDVVLGSGSLPLPVLEQAVDRYIGYPPF